MSIKDLWDKEIKEFLEENKIQYKTRVDDYYLNYNGYKCCFVWSSDEKSFFFHIIINLEYFDIYQNQIRKYFQDELGHVMSSYTSILAKYMYNFNTYSNADNRGIEITRIEPNIRDGIFTTINDKIIDVFKVFDETIDFIEKNNIIENIQNIIDQEQKEDESKVDEIVQDEKEIEKVEIKEEKNSMENNDIHEELNKIIGLDSVKEHLKELENKIITDKHREKMGLKVNQRAMHTLFLGNPGTGKTTVARLFGNILQKYGVLEKGHVVEVSRKDLVGQHLGHTAPKTNEKIEESFGGILFIDEAYTLQQDERDIFGSEAIDTVLKAMEDKRDEFIVIAAGYPEPMEKFLDSNPGLKSRFNDQFLFEDYSSSELMDISKLMLKAMDYTLSADANVNLKRIFDELIENKDDKFGNARLARNIVEDSIQNQNSRVAELIKNDELLINKELLMTINSKDIDKDKFINN